MSEDTGTAIICTLDIEVYDEWGDHTWAQARYLVHGTDDVLWTNDGNEAAEYLRSELVRLRSENGSTREDRP